MADKAYYRFVLLFFNCLLSFGPYFCHDIPSALQDRFQGNLTCFNTTATNGTVDCVLGLGLSPQQYNSLFTISSWAYTLLVLWLVSALCVYICLKVGSVAFTFITFKVTGATVTIMSGFFIDKLGNTLGLYVFSLLCILGSSLFALGSHFQGTPHLLPLMLVGRFLFGAGSMSLVVLQDRITAIWFKDQELGLAFGLTLGVSRLGSVLNFLVTESFDKEYGMQWTLWGGVLLCVIGLFIAMIVSTLDKIGMRQLGRESVIQEESRKMSILDLKLFPLRFWLLTLSTVFFYNIIFPFLANASEFFQDKYSGYSRKEGAYIAGAIYDVPLVLTAFVGVLVDYVGLRVIFFAASSVLSLLAFGLLAFTYVPPLVSTIILGVTYSCVAVCAWPSIALVVPQATVGTAMGLVLSMVMAGNGVCNLIIGWILGTTSSQAKIPLWRWQWMMIFMVANTVCCLITSVLLNVVDHRQGGTLNKTTKRSKQREGETLTKKSLHKTLRSNSGPILFFQCDPFTVPHTGP